MGYLTFLFFLSSSVLCTCSFSYMYMYRMPTLYCYCTVRHPFPARRLEPYPTNCMSPSCCESTKRGRERGKKGLTLVLSGRQTRSSMGSQRTVTENLDSWSIPHSEIHQHIIVCIHELLSQKIWTGIKSGPSPSPKYRPRFNFCWPKMDHWVHFFPGPLFA